MWVSKFACWLTQVKSLVDVYIVSALLAFVHVHQDRGNVPPSLRDLVPSSLQPRKMSGTI